MAEGGTASGTVAPALWRPRRNPWASAITVTLATFMEVLDTSIANVALPHMAGSLGASQEEATWVLTSYLVSSAVILPISGWLMARMGRKRFYMTCVMLFTICSRTFVTVNSTNKTPEKNTAPSAVGHGTCIPRHTEYVKYAFNDIPGAMAIG